MHAEFVLQAAKSVADSTGRDCERIRCSGEIAGPGNGFECLQPAQRGEPSHRCLPLRKAQVGDEDFSFECPVFWLDLFSMHRERFNGRAPNGRRFSHCSRPARQELSRELYTLLMASPPGAADHVLWTLVLSRQCRVKVASRKPWPGARLAGAIRNRINRWWTGFSQPRRRDRRDACWEEARSDL